MRDNVQTLLIMKIQKLKCRENKATEHCLSALVDLQGSVHTLDQRTPLLLRGRSFPLKARPYKRYNRRVTAKETNGQRAEAVQGCQMPCAPHQALPKISSVNLRSGWQTLPGIFGRQGNSTKNIPCSSSKNSIVTTTTTIKHRICLVAYILQNTSIYIIQLGFEHLCHKKMHWKF